MEIFPNLREIQEHQSKYNCYDTIIDILFRPQQQHKQNYNPTIEPNESSITDSAVDSEQPLLSKDDELKHQTSHTTLPRQPSQLTVSHRSNSTAPPIAPPTTHPIPHPTTQPTHSGTGQSSIPTETYPLLGSDKNNEQNYEYMSGEVDVNTLAVSSALVVNQTQEDTTLKPIPETQPPSNNNTFMQTVQRQHSTGSKNTCFVGISNDSTFPLPPNTQFSRSISQPQNQVSSQ